MPLFCVHDHDPTHTRARARTHARTHTHARDPPTEDKQRFGDIAVGVVGSVCGARLPVDRRESEEDLAFAAASVVLGFGHHDGVVARTLRCH